MVNPTTGMNYLSTAIGKIEEVIDEPDSWSDDDLAAFAVYSAKIGMLFQMVAEGVGKDKKAERMN